MTFNAQAEVINEDQAVEDPTKAAPEAAAAVTGDSSTAAVDTAVAAAAAAAVESAESAAAVAAAQPHLNLPAVLWDRPAGSKTKVPPPVPPRSPRKPIDPSGAFEAALSREAAAAAAASAAAAAPQPASAGGPSRGWSSLPPTSLHILVSFDITSTTLVLRPFS